MSQRLIRMHPDFRRLWIGDGISKVGSGTVTLAMPVLAATTLEATTWEVALLATFAGLPWLLIGLPVGAWVDRLRRRPLMIAADVARAAALSWVPVAALLGVLAVPQLYIVQIVVGAGTVLFDISAGAYLPSLVGRGPQLVAANGVLEANRSVAHAAGPATAGQLVQWFGAPLTLIGSVIGYLWSALWLAAIRTPEPAPARSAKPSLSREIREGLRFVWHQPLIRATTLHGSVAVLCLSTRYAIEVLFLLRDVGTSPGVIGALFAAAGVAAVMGALVASRIAHAIGRTRTLLVSGLAMGLGSLLIPLTGTGPRLAFYVAGAGMVAFWIVVNRVVSASLRQVLCPDRLLGRMNATATFLAWATLPLGGVVGGALGTAVGLRGALWCTSIGLLLSWLLLVFSPACRARDLPDGGQTR